MPVDDCRELKPADQRAGRRRQRPFPLGAIGSHQRIPQGAVVRCPPGLVDEYGIERDSLERRLHELPGVLVGASPKQMELRRGVRAESGGGKCRQQLDGSLRRMLPQRQVRRQEVAPRRQIVVEGLPGELVQQLGRPIRPSDAQKQRDGLQRKVLGCRAPSAPRQRHVLVRGFRVAAIRDELERSGFRHDLGRLAHLRGLAPGEHDHRSHEGNNGVHRTIRLACALSSRIHDSWGR